MRSFRSATLSFTTYVLLILAFCGLPLSNAAECQSELGCGSGLTRLVSVHEVTPTPTWQPFRRQRITNAERLARGLPLNPPTRRRYDAHHASPSPSSVPMVTYHGVLQVFALDGSSLGYVATDPVYWTPLLTTDISIAQTIEFQLPTGATSGTMLQFQQLNRPTPLLGLVQGRDSTSDNIAPGSFNYLYFDGVFAPGTPPGSTPQNVPSEFSTATGLQKAAETSIWNVDLVTGAVTVQWINTDSSTPTTVTFLQSNHLYAGGDPNAFHSRFPAPVTVVTLKFVPTT